MKKILLPLLAVAAFLTLACNNDHLKGTEWLRTVNDSVKINDKYRRYVYTNDMVLDGKSTGYISQELRWIGGASTDSIERDSILSNDTASLTYDYDADASTGTLNWQGAIWHFAVDGRILTLYDSVAYLENDTVPVPFHQK